MKRVIYYTQKVPVRREETGYARDGRGAGWPGAADMLGAADSPGAPASPVEYELQELCVESDDDAVFREHLETVKIYSAESGVPYRVEEVLPPLEDVRAAKLAELGAACEAAIFAGVEVVTSQGTERFSLTINDQTNIGNLALQAQTGAAVPYHADGRLCRMFAPEEMRAVADEAVKHKTYHTARCNHLNVWARRAQTREELAGIAYDAELPGDLAGSLAELISVAPYTTGM